MTSEPEYVLAPCPCCSGRARLEKKRGKTGVASPCLWYRETVICKGCGLSIVGKRPGAAIEAWNRRAARPTAPIGEPVAWANLGDGRKAWLIGEVLMLSADIDADAAVRFAEKFSGVLLAGLAPPDTAAIRAQARREALEEVDTLTCKLWQMAAREDWSAERLTAKMLSGIRAMKRPAPPATEGGREP